MKTFLHRNNIILASVVMSVILLLGSCTKNDGDIGFWFGLWKVKAISVDGATVEDYAGDMFFAFQNNVVEQKLNSVYHDRHSSFGKWSEESGDSLILTFDDPWYAPLDGYMQRGVNKLGYTHSEKSMTWTYVTTDDRQVKFILEKW